MIKKGLLIWSILFWSSITIYSSWLLTLIISKFIDLEITNKTVENIYAGIGFWGFIVLIVLTLIKTTKKTHSTEFIVIKVFVTFCLTVVFGYILGIILLFTGMCTWDTDEIYYINKEDYSIKIVCRNFGCGATDSSPVFHRVFKIKELTSYLIWIQNEIDTNTIDKREWIRQ